MARRAVVEDIVSQLTDGSSRGVLIVGSRGAGKTWMLGEILNALGPRIARIRLSASKALMTIPFGAVNARVGVKLVRSDDYYEVLNAFLEQIHAASTTSDSLVLIVDNAEYLDRESAAIILQVVMSSAAKLIVVDHPGGHKNYLRELWREGHLTRFDVAPLQSEAVRMLLEGVLGGKIARPAIDYLASRSAGNPLVLHGLVAGAREEGSLHKVNNVWILDHPEDRLGTESWELLQMELTKQLADSRGIIEMLALAGPLPLEVILDLTSVEAVDDIQQRELVEVVPGAVLTMRLARPATATAIRDMVPLGRSRRFLREVSKFVTIDDQSNPEMIINFTRWSLDCGLPVNDERILAATVYANQLMRPLEALQFSKSHEGTPHQAALLAERSIAYLNQNCAVTARKLSMHALEIAHSPEAGASALRAVQLSHSSAMDYEVCFDEAYLSFVGRFGDVVLNDFSSRADIDVLITLAIKNVSVGRMENLPEGIQALLAHPMTENVADRVLLKSLLVEVLSATGQMSTAVAMALDVVAELERPEGFPRPDIAILAYTRSVAAFIYDGAWDYATAALEPAIFTNPDLMLHSGGLRDLAAAMMQVRRGYLQEALAGSESAVHTLKDYDPWSVLPTAMGLQAYCLVMHGDLPGSQGILSQLALLNRRSGKFYELEGVAYAAAAQFMTGQSELGLARLWSLQRECLEHGYLGIELTVLSLLVRVGDAAAILRLVEVAERLESSSKEFFVRWSAAMRSQDAASLEQASATAMQYGFELVAVELATHALNKFSVGGKIHKSRKAANKVVAMRENMPGLVSPVFQTIDQPKMTRREHQIALLVAQGESNSSIAARLNVSLRTIEGHLYRTFIKLDIQSREQLTSLMAATVPDNPGPPVALSRPV